MNSRPLLPRALLLNRWRETSFSWFLRLLRRDGFSTCTLNKVQRRMKWRGGGARNVWLTSKCGQKSLLIYIIVDPRALLLVAQGCFAVWLLRLKSSTPSKSALKRLIFKWWEWRGRFDYGCLYKPVGWSTRPPFPLMCLSSLVQKCFGKVWKRQRSLLMAASLTVACLLLRVLQLQKHNLQLLPAFKMQPPCKPVPNILLFSSCVKV